MLWEYLNLDLLLHEGSDQYYLLRGEGKEPLIGVDNILDAYGGTGWELVSLQPVEWKITGNSQTATKLFATLKKKVS